MKNIILYFLVDDSGSIGETSICLYMTMLLLVIFQVLSVPSYVISVIDIGLFKDIPSVIQQLIVNTLLALLAVTIVTLFLGLLDWICHLLGR